MGLSHAPRVITDGIVLALDAANTRSYVGSGTTWTDLIGSNNGTLTNGPVFTQEPKLEPFGGAGAVEFDGTGDYLTAPDSSGLLSLPGSFTIELFTYFSTVTSQVTFVCKTEDNSQFAWFLQYIASSGGIRFYPGTGGGIGTPITFAWTPSTGTWYHLALTRDASNNVRMFVDGVQIGNTSTNTDNLSSTGQITIGDNIDVLGTQELNGYISNLRIIKGRALYTSNFTPPRKKLEVTSDTVLLTCEKGTIKDRSSSAHAITINGNAKSISGASYFEFDGVDDYVSGNLSTLTSWSMCIWYLSTDITSKFVFYPFSCNNAANGLGFGGTNDSTTNGRWYFFDGTNVLSSTNTAVTTNVWYNLVVTKSSTTYNLYTNGSLSLNTSGVDLNCTLYSLGRRGDGLWYAKGNIAQASIYNRALTAAEVSQNYNALRGRYGI